MKVTDIHRMAVEIATAKSIDFFNTLTQEEKDSLLMDFLIQKAVVEEERELNTQSKYVASSEGLQLSIFDYAIRNMIESDEDFDAQVEASFQKRIKEQAELAEYYADYLRKKAERAECKSQKLFKLASVEGLKKKPSAKARKMNTVTEVVVEKVEGPDRFCSECGTEMKPVGYKSRIELEYVPGYYKAREIRREVVACPKHCTDEDGKAIIRTAKPKEPALLPKSLATASLVAGINYEKYMLGTPLYRFEKAMKSLGMTLNRQTMSNISEKCYDLYLAPLCEQMLLDLREQKVVHMDETRLQCLEVKDRKLSTMVIAASGIHEEKQMTIYQFFEGKAQQFVPDVLGDHFSHALMTDGLKAYQNYPGDGCVKINCMAHARRKFYDALKVRNDYQNFVKRLQKHIRQTEGLNLSVEEAEERIFNDEIRADLKKSEGMHILIAILCKIARLYRVESQFSDNLDVLKLMREDISRPTFDSLCELVQDIYDRGFPEGSLPWKAANYFLEQKAGLENYLKDPRYPIDNNLAERGAKAFAVDRKNFLFSNSIHGAIATAAYMSLLKSAEQNGLSPYRYLEYILSQLKYYQDEPIPEEVIQKLVPYSKELPKELYVQKEIVNNEAPTESQK